MSKSIVHKPRVVFVGTFIWARQEAKRRELGPGDFDIVTRGNDLLGQGQSHVKFIAQRQYLSRDGHLTNSDNADLCAHILKDYQYRGFCQVEYVG